MRSSDLPESNCVGHEPCPACGSRDNLARYDDGHGYCFGCGHYEHANGETKEMPENVTKLNHNHGEYTSIPDRRISEDTCRKYGVTTEVNGGGTIEKHNYPYHDREGNYVGSKVRFCKFKQFKATGNIAKGTLFGQRLFKSEGKYVTVVEGELDALAAYELLGSRWPVVSVKGGAGNAKKEFQQNLEWLEGFENVVICFDADEHGRKAAEQCAEVLSPNKARIVHFEKHKDSSDYLVNGDVKAYTQEWWNAKPFIMSGVVTLEDVWDDFVNRGNEEVIPFPECFSSLNGMLNGGMAQGEITVLGALTSVGKTTFVNEIIYHIWKNTDKTVGCAFLEASNGEAIENLLTIHTEHNLAFEDRESLDYETLKTDIITDGRILLLDHHGAVDADDLFIKLRSMVKGNGADVLVIDPLQAAVTSNSNEVIDDFMDRLLKLAKETNVSILVVSHMKKPSITNPHNVSEYDLKGSGSINQIAFNTILMSRDKMSEDEYNRNSTMVQVVKCRRTGMTGLAGWVLYDHLTGRLTRGEPPQIHEAGQEEEF